MLGECRRANPVAADILAGVGNCHCGNSAPEKTTLSRCRKGPPPYPHGP